MPATTINCRGKLISLDTPKVIGILNVTPDSFFDGGKHAAEDEILAKTEEMLSEGADFIDIGGYSSRPGAAFVSEEEELGRIVPAVKLVSKRFPEAIISVDTFRSNVAKACVENGAAMINDISAGLLDEKMIETVSGLSVPYIMMHIRGTPQTMQQFTDYDDIISNMLFYFSQRIAAARETGINDLILDPGFGFSKTLEQNYEVLRKLDLFDIAGVPLLIGISRKSIICKALVVSPENALNGTTALHMAALQKGAKVLRVHDVKEAVECVKLFGFLGNQTNGRNV
ncbi:MAG TPA: dihydropteroate synthase [Flavobacterium sp.]|jgi:dihydropteroate synthase